MFGGTSSWGQPQQQQQQQQQGGGLFGGGTTGGFGQQQNTSTFGQPATGGFGQPAQQQNTGGGLFGGGSTGSTGFGGFGGGAQQTQQSNAFGAARPTFGATGSTFGQPPQQSTGGGLFGSTAPSTGFGSTSTTSSGGLFGAKPATSTGFGAGATSGLFGAKPTTTFGQAPGGNQEVLKGPNELQTYRTDVPLPPPPAQGTANPAYYPTWQGDPSTTAMGKEGPPHLFHSITGMLPYRGCSPEELRALDYQQNRKEATQQPTNTFGASTGGFGQPAQTGFGQQPSTTFGAPKPAGGLFGSTGSTGFGATSTGFGSTPANTSGGLFGQTQPQQQNQSPFGQSTTGTTGGLFGQPAQNQQQPAAGGGLFGNTNPFGGQNNQQQQQQTGTSTFGGFGQTKPAFGATGSTGFGATGANTGTSTFGQTSATGSTGFGGFGQTQPNQQQQQPATGGLFGGGGFGSTAQQPQQSTGTGLFGQTGQQQQPATGGFGAPKPAGGLFGSTTTPASTGTSGFGGFGQTAPAQPASTGLFGQTNPPASTGTGLFGQTQPQQNAQQPASTGLFGSTGTSGGLFGAKPATTAPSTGLFGQTQPAQQPAQTGTGLFGNTGSTGTGLFGNTGSTLGQQNQQQNNSLAKPAGTGLFGGGTGLFGSTAQPQQQQQTGTTGGLFGNLGQSQPASTGLFGNTSTQQPQQSNLGGSLFSGLGQSTFQQPQQQQQPSLTASIDQSPYGNNQLFQYTGQKLEYGSQSKKPALPPLTASSYRLTPSTKGKVNKLRGFASPLTASQSPARSSTPLGSVNSPGRSSLLGSPAAPDRYKGLTDTALTPNAFVPRPSIKKLTVTPKVLGSNGSSDQLESVLGKSALRSSTGSLVQPTPERAAIAPGSPASNFFNPPAATNGFSRQPERVDSPHRRNASLADSSSLRVSGSERAPKKGEYWCKPKMEKLRQLSRQELSELHNFTAGRRGFGEVTFLEPVDLTLAPLEDLLDTIIVFDQSELSVYPDDYPAKAPQGQGLNVPARITLENVFAHDKATKEPVRDPSDPRYTRFLKRVKNIPNTEFVGYTDDGTWTFKVEHFSRYGIDDSDEDEVEPQTKAAPPKKTASSDQSSSRTPETRDDDEDEDMLPPTKGLRDFEDVEHDSGLEEEEENSFEEEESFDEEMDDTFADMPAQPTWDQPIKQKIGAEGMRKLREMQTSFFGHAPPAQPGVSKSVLGRFDKKRDLKARANDSFFGEAGEDIVKLDERAVKRTSFGETAVSPPKLRQPRKYSKVTIADSVVDGKEGMRADAGLALGRSFRCSWGPNGELVHFGQISAPEANFSPDTQAIVHIEKVEILANEAKVEKAQAQRLLNLHLEHTLVDTLDGVPFAAIDSAIRFRDFASSFDAGDRSHEASVFRLGVALFDEVDLRLPEDASEDLMQRIASIRRKLALSKWLEDAVAPSVDSDLIANGEDRPAKVFTLLSGHQVERAVQSALEGGDLRLATLISQAGGEAVFREEVLKQLEDWQKYKADPLIGLGYRKLYALLAGLTDISPGDPSRGSDGCPDVLIAKDLDWKRALGLQMWYGNSFEDTISDVVSAYDESLSSAHPPARPLPSYMETPSNLPRKWNNPTEPADIIYNLIKLYSDIAVSLDQVLRSRDTSASPIDVRLAWHLYLLLSRVLDKRDFEDREDDGYSATADQLTASYAAQLEVSGEWKWAAFVLLHLETADGREKSLRNLTFRHPDMTAEDEHFLTASLKVPASWIHESRAASFSSAGNAWAEYHALLQAGLWDRAHKVLIDKLAPEAVIRDDKALLRRLCSGLDGRGAAGWEFGGKLFLEWADLTTDTARLLSSVLQAGSHPDPRDSAALTEHTRTLPRVLQLLPALFPDKRDTQQVASLSEMLSPLYQLAGVLHNAGYIAKQSVPTYLVDEDRIHLLQGAAYESFNKSLDALPAVSA
ncbi:nuclear pore complex protein Nup98-Nup96 [Kwoniella heveanensis BCC8398]|uniref:Nuclear pore complex protein Nup98-Nup96 n=1 Tax=Kwoniella heveanensis BCC8398 TaxID=1296120 RepID=A0A1B9GW88_9TREE|nr:nuclear pore complex protein Nup98-Nup96 [Kwoniella heveanensis BCC8398]